MADKKIDELIKGLNEDLAAEFQAIMMYTTYGAEVDGIHRTELKGFFHSEIADEQSHALLLADKIVALGGVPTTRAAPVKSAKTNKARIENALEAEIETIARYTTRIEQAEAAGQLGLKILLEDLVQDESNHRDEMQIMLRNFRD